jgi:hypothetical protein
MTNHGRQPHVRPRPPSSGRPRQAVRAAAPSVQRVRAYRGLEARRRRLPIVSQALLALSVVTLGGAVFLSATGGIGPLVASLGHSLDDAFGRLLATSQPSATEVIATDAPIIAAPVEPFTNKASATLRITVPVNVIGTAATVRVYVALQGLALTPVIDVPIGDTTQVAVGVKLSKGRNDFSATVIRNGAESPEAPIVTIVLDKDPPRISISSPKQDATVTGRTVAIVGTTQPGSNVIARNTTSGSTAAGPADGQGHFRLEVTIEQGPNDIEIEATDQAGNVTTKRLTVKQGSGDMKAHLSASFYTISVSHPPRSLQLRVLVTDPGGNPLAGATASFTLTIPGLQPISSGPRTTDESGRASFTTSLVTRMKTGYGLATVIITSAEFGTTTDQVRLIFVK